MQNAEYHATAVRLGTEKHILDLRNDLYEFIELARWEVELDYRTTGIYLVSYGSKAGRIRIPDGT